MPQNNDKSGHIDETSRFFPEKLKQIDDCPDYLFYRGNIDLLLQPTLSVVGSRKLSKYGMICIDKIVPDLVQAGATICSGLALGCDAYSQKVALASGGPVIAVLPGPVDNIYPRSSTNLAKAIVERGGLIISECPSGSSIHKGSFLRRNRIVSAIADGLLVIEAGLRSGTLSTVNHALRQGVEVMAIPGDINRPNSLGTNSFIQSGAHLVQSSQDILATLNWKTTSERDKKRIKGENNIENLLIRLLKNEPLSTEALSARSQLATETVMTNITMLEIRGITFVGDDNRWHLK